MYSIHILPPYFVSSQNVQCSNIQCPFSKPFQSLIKECCGPLKERISVNKLVEHKFFKGANCPNPEAITNFFGHILKSTEQRINSSLAAPPSMKTNNIDVDGTLLGGNENVNDSNNGPNILLNGNALNNGNEGSSHTGPETADSGKGDNPISLTDSDFSFSTRLDPSMLENIRAKSHETPPPTTHTDPPTVGTIHENEEASPKQPSDIVAPNGPTMHNPPITSGGSTSVSYNDPASSHHLTPRQNPTQSPLGHPVDQEFQVTDELMQSTRNYRFSFSESKSQMNCVMSPTDSVSLSFCVHSLSLSVLWVHSGWHTMFTSLTVNLNDVLFCFSK